MNDSVRIQLLQRLESIRASGVEFLPRVEVPMADLMENASDDNSSIDIVEPLADEKALGDLPVRRMELQMLAERVSKCMRCPELASTRTQTVFGTGPLNAELCFIGEAPGADEDRLGEPFVGAAGQLLNRIIVAMGMRREDVYICNVLRCRPPGNRTPKPEEAENCREYLERQIDLIQPKFICTLGVPAAQTLLKSQSILARLRGRFYSYKSIPVICTYHPASLLPHRSPEKKKDVWDDMKMLLTKMGRPIPDRTSS